MPEITLPPFLKSHQTPAGNHHLGIKALFYGPPKSGKSFALASFPSPIMALACGESGIELYLHPERGDVSVFVGDAKTYTEALEFALNHPKVASIAIDSVNLAFEDWMSSWEDELKVEEIKGGNWRKVKGPWKILHRKMMLSSKNVGLSAWPRGAKYAEEVEPSSIPGVEAKKRLVIMEQDSPHVEKMLPFAVDMTLKTEIELDRKFAPTSIHRITYMGGRRPASIPANELYSGKFWRFDSKRVDEESPFDKVLKPIIAKWQTGAVEYIGLNTKEAEMELGEAHMMMQDQIVGAFVASCEVAKTLDELRSLWLTAEADVNKTLTPERRKIVEAAKDRRKIELGGK